VGSFGVHSSKDLIQHAHKPPSDASPPVPFKMAKTNSRGQEIRLDEVLGTVDYTEEQQKFWRLAEDLESGHVSKRGDGLKGRWENKVYSSSMPADLQADLKAIFDRTNKAEKL